MPDEAHSQTDFFVNLQERKAVDDYIRTKVKEVFACGTTELSEMLLTLAEDAFVMGSLPSGVGIHAKRSLVEAELKLLNPNNAENNC